MKDTDLGNPERISWEDITKYETWKGRCSGYFIGGEAILTS